VTEVERFQAIAEDGDTITVVKYKLSPSQDLNGDPFDFDEYVFALPDGTPLGASIDYNVFWLDLREKHFRRVAESAEFRPPGQSGTVREFRRMRTDRAFVELPSPKEKPPESERLGSLWRKHR
jgi:hypothetical protein